MESQSIEYSIIGIYVLFMFAIGMAFKKLNTSDDDYFRSGCRATWWLVGAGIFMSSISVFSFTIVAGLAFEGGWSVTLVFIVNTLCYLICWLFLGARFRQMRRITWPQVIQDRFGVSLQQVMAYYSCILFLVFGAVQLYSLSIFANGVFGLPVGPTILAVGFVVGFYSVSGGNWAVIATDFVQGILLIPITMLVAYLCLKETGGIMGLLEMIQNAGLREDFRLVKPAGYFEDDKFSPMWIASLLLIQVLANLGMVNAAKFFAVKDSPGASRASLLVAILMGLGSALWFIPPIAARVLFEQQVLATDIALPAEASYAVVARNLLPAGLTGLMMVAMFGASMSTLDTALNKNSAMFVEDILPAIRRLLGKGEHLTPRAALTIGRIFTLSFAATITIIAIWFAKMSGVGAFGIGFKLNAMVTIPTMTPLFLGIFIKRTPRWAGWISFGAALVPSVIGASFPGLISTHLNGILCFVAGTGFFLLTIPFWKNSPAEEREKTEEFFTRMRTPIDFEKEVGEANDHIQLRILGRLSLALSVFLFSLLLIPQDSWRDRIGIVFVAGFVLVVGVVMSWRAKKKAHA